MDDVALARALHVLGVVIWIGGASMATTVILQALRRGDLGDNRLAMFEAVEHRFIWQARIAVLVVGLTGLYMTWRFDLWDRFHSLSFWWMHAMVGVWLLFAFVLFIGEPLILSAIFTIGSRPIRIVRSCGCIARTGCWSALPGSPCSARSPAAMAGRSNGWSFS